ncbi:hypothetical protein [Rhodospirillaceae bacterium SYSU D60014]|uniref:hypothetical protein n=1 Tax=Virgifigura deserti TaxID=2268457 RepID=UPI000E6754A0
MTSPINARHDLFQRLYFDERTQRDLIRGSIGTPVAAISFSVFAFGTLVTEFDMTQWRQPASIFIIALACGSIAAMFAAIYHVVMVEWLFVYYEPPDLHELLAAEERIRAERPDQVETQLTELMTASYFIGYQQYLCGNTVSARNRTWALRLVMASLLQQAVCFLLLPIHLAGSGG